jgi:hypothetical protein
MTALTQPEQHVLALRPRQHLAVWLLFLFGLAGGALGIIWGQVSLFLLAAATVCAALVWVLDSWRLSHLLVTDKRIVQARALGLLVKEVLLEDLSVETREIVLKGNPDTPAIRLSSRRATIELNPYTFGAGNIRTLVDGLARRGFAIPDRILEWLDWELGPPAD